MDTTTGPTARWWRTIGAIVAVLAALAGLGASPAEAAQAVEQPPVDELVVPKAETAQEEVDTVALWERHNEEFAAALRIQGEVGVQVVGGYQTAVPSWFVQGFCGGTLVAPQWVVSAEHCGNRVGSSYLIGGVESRRIVGQWSLRANAGSDQDIAVWKLDQPTGLPTLAMSNNYALDDTGRWVQGMGYGATCGNCPQSPVFKTTGWVQVVEGDTNVQNSFTFGNPNGTTCFGDSGGPVVGDANPPNAQLILVGVVSYTINEPTSCVNRAGAAKIADNYNWIWSVINSQGGPGNPGGPPPPPPPPGGNCRYTVTNDSAERISIIEHYGRGIIPEDNFIDPGQTLTYQIQSNEFVPNQNWLSVYVGGGWNSGGEYVDQFVGPCGTAFTYGDGNPNPDPDPDGCTYTVTNDSAERISIIEHYGRGIIPEDNFIDPGQTLTYQIQSNEFVPNQNWLSVYVGGGWNSGGEYVDQFVGPCGTAFTYGDAPPPPPPPDPDPVSGSIAGTVTDTAGDTVTGLAIDLFTSDQDGDRTEFLTSTTTANNGTYTLDVDPGCYVVTFIAPDGRTFTNSQGWLNTAVCAEADETISDIDATLTTSDGVSRIGDTVTDTTGAGVAGVAIDLFTANADGTRGSYLRSTTSASDGNYGFEVDPGCHIVTFIAPAGRTFTNTSNWLNRYVCVDTGESDTSADAVLTTDGDTATIAGTVTQNSRGVTGVTIDLFTTTADGQRGTWITNTTTDNDGTYQLDQPAGCYTLTFIAPDNQTFTNGQTWLNRAFCVEAGGTSTGNDAALS